ncbi:phospholipase D [Ramlibacter tataouinensis]|uniref:Phospholipase D n=1 Tax=Ramlibacter tataouinensis TaxID=94132 RepID=A0A127JZL2_9BURK|nr:phospholipase D [Ramlibacter tataouinensis]
MATRWSLRHAASPHAWRSLLAILLLGWAAGCASLPANDQRTPSQAFAAPDQTALGRLVAQGRAQAGAQQGSGFMLLDGVEAAFAGRLALIEAAQRSLDLQYYAVHADASTERLLQALRQAARRGVRVRLLLDDFNTVGKDAQVLRLAFEPHIEIRLFNPLTGSRASLVGRLVTSLNDASRIQKRMHNKLFIADNAIGITGGRNLGDAYFGGDDKSSFVDLDVLAAGRIVRDMSASFDRYWNDELAYPMHTLVSAADLERLRDTATPSGTPGALPAIASQAAASAPVLPNVTPAAAAPPLPASLDLARLRLVWAPAVLMQDHPDKIGPGDDELAAGDTVVDGLLQLMDGAREDVLIVSPYFVPGTAMMDLFRRLKGRGVKVRVLTNSLASNDALAAHAGYARYRKDLLALGIELYEMRAGPEANGASGSAGGESSATGSRSGSSRPSLHSKAVVIDGRLSVIGSMNLDLRSQRSNSEVALLIRSAALARATQGRIEAMIKAGAYRLELAGGGLAWRAPQGAAFQDATSEPEASTTRKMLVRLIAPFAPDEML